MWLIALASWLQQEGEHPERPRAAEGQGGGEEGVAEAGAHAAHRWSSQMLTRIVSQGIAMA